MSWPTDDISTDSVDSNTDTPDRAEFFKLFTRVKEMLSARGVADGIAGLDTNSKVPDAQLGRGQANGVAALDNATKVPNAQLHRGEANGVASLDANGKVPAEEISETGAWEPGDVKWTFRADTPDGWTAADGRNVAREGTYARVFAAYGTRFGAGDGSSTFGLPNVQRRTLIGAGGTASTTIGATLGSTGGAETHTLTEEEMPSHTHSTRVSSRTIVAAGPQAPVSNSAPSQSGATGGDQPHNNMQPSIVARCLIKL